MFVNFIDDVESTPIPYGTGVTKQVLIAPENAPHFAMRCFTIQPGGSMPNHTNQVEHEQFVISGRGQVGIDGDVFEVGPGNIVFIPENVPHWYAAVGDEPFRFLCLVPNLPDETRVIA